MHTSKQRGLFCLPLTDALARALLRGPHVWLQKALAAIAAGTSSGAFAYNKFVAIGLFRLLELTGAKEPAALERLVKAVGVKPEAVNRDLMMYKASWRAGSAARANESCWTALLPQSSRLAS